MLILQFGKTDSCGDTELDTMRLKLFDGSLGEF